MRPMNMTSLLIYGPSHKYLRLRLAHTLCCHLNSTLRISSHWYKMESKIHSDCHWVSSPLDGTAGIQQTQTLPPLFLSQKVRHHVDSLCVCARVCVYVCYVIIIYIILIVNILYLQLLYYTYITIQI